MQVYLKSDAQERAQWVSFAQQQYSAIDAGAPETERLVMQFGAQISAEQAQLLKAQIHLEEESVMKRWTGGPFRFAGLSLFDTLRKLIQVGEIVEADNLRSHLKVSDKRYWRLKIRALADSGNFSELNSMAANRTSPIGYEPFIEAFLKHRREDLAVPFVPKVKSAAAQARFYSRMGMED